MAISYKIAKQIKKSLAKKKVHEKEKYCYKRLAASFHAKLIQREFKRVIKK